MDRAELLPKAVSRYFADAADHVHELLLEYDGPEADRVRLDIIKLADGDMSRIPGLLKDAASDYRDVIAWAEQPVRKKAKLNEYTLKKADEMDRKQFHDWLAALDDC